MNYPMIKLLSKAKVIQQNGNSFHSRVRDADKGSKKNCCDDTSVDMVEVVSHKRPRLDK